MMWKDWRERHPPDLPFSPLPYQRAHNCALCAVRCNFGTGDSSGINSEKGPRMQIERHYGYAPDRPESEIYYPCKEHRHTAAIINCSQVYYLFMCSSPADPIIRLMLHLKRSDSWEMQQVRSHTTRHH